MCFGGGDSTTNVYQQQQIPAWVENYAQGNVNLAANLAERPYQPYQGPRVAPLSEQQRGAIQSAEANQGAYLPTLNQAQGLLAGNAARNFGDVATSYMNPFINEVLQPQLREIGRQSDIARLGINQRATSAGAFGDARHGIAESELARNTQQLMADTYGKGMAAAYNAAAGQFNIERNAQQQAALGLANLAPQFQQLGQRDAAFMYDLGERIRALQQAGYDVSHQDFVNQFRYPEEGLNLRLAALQGSPYTTTRISETTAPGGSQTAQNLGAFASLLGVVPDVLKLFK
jgi:hypothetical protein